jgi:serine/threonine protein kinase
MDEFEWVRSFATSNYGTINEALVPSQSDSLPAAASRPVRPSRGSFASFVCHVVSLERKLRSFSPIVLDDSSVVKETGKILGEGTTFMVRHAQWIKNPDEPPLDVALKEIIADIRSSDGSSSDASKRPQSDWKDILFELRALLHEPIRYHPNLVRLLGIQWGLSPMSESTYPMLIMEYGSLGTFNALQASSEPLSFPIKQKLCYDVGRGLSALHACGIVHGDMKHENVLIFPIKKAIDGLPYTAKLGDFGGTIMDMAPTESRVMGTWTWPFEAPEVSNHQPLTKSGMMLTDTYSFGLLLWRAFMDGEGFVNLRGASQTAPDLDKDYLSTQKSSEDFTSIAITNVSRYAVEKDLPQPCLDLFLYAILHTVRSNPKDRDLTKAQVALRGIK